MPLQRKTQKHWLLKVGENKGVVLEEESLGTGTNHKTNRTMDNNNRTTTTRRHSVERAISATRKDTCKGTVRRRLKLRGRNSTRPTW